MMIDLSQARDLPNGCPVAAQLIGVNDLWYVIFAQQPGQEGLCGLSVTVLLKENIEHEAVLVDRTPQPMSDAIDARTHLV